MGFVSQPGVAQPASGDGGGWPEAVGGTPNPANTTEVMAAYAAACSWTAADNTDAYGGGVFNMVPNFNTEAANAVTSPARVNFAGITPIVSVYQTPLNRPLSSNTGDMADITAGNQDAFFQQIISNWSGWPTPIYIRLGYEINYPNTQYGIDFAGSMLADWVPMYQHIYTVFAAQAQALGITLIQMWNPALANSSNMGWDFRQAYPGNAYVDCIALDIYESVECLDTPAVYTNPVPYQSGALNVAQLGPMVSGGSQNVAPGYGTLALGSAAQLAGGTTWIADTTGLINMSTGNGNAGASWQDVQFHYLDWPDANATSGPTGNSMQLAGTATISTVTSVGMMDMIHWCQFCNANNVGQGGVVGATGAMNKTNISLAFPEFGIWLAGMFVDASGNVVGYQGPNGPLAMSWEQAAAAGATGVADGIYLASYSSPATSINAAAQQGGTLLPSYMQSRILYAQSLGIDVSIACWFVSPPNAWLAIRPQVGTAAEAIGWIYAPDPPAQTLWDQAIWDANTATWT